MSGSDCFRFEVVAQCKKTRARVGKLWLKSTSSFGLLKFFLAILLY